MILLLKKGKKPETVVKGKNDNTEALEIDPNQDSTIVRDFEEVININVEKDPFDNVISRKAYISSRPNSMACMASDLESLESRS